MKYLFLVLLLVLVVQGSQADITNNIFQRPIQFTTTTNRFSQYRQSFIDILHSLMQNSIKLSNQDVHLMQTEIEEIFSQVCDGILAEEQSANNILTQIMSDYERLFVSGKIILHPCVEKYMQAMKNITSNGQKFVQKCIETVTEEVDNIREIVTPYIESINSSMDIINKVDEQCSRSTNDIAIGICVVQNVDVVANTATAISVDINEAVRLATLKMYVVGENAQICIQSSLISIKKEVEDVVAVANRCATDN